MSRVLPRILDVGPISDAVWQCRALRTTISFLNYLSQNLIPFLCFPSNCSGQCMWPFCWGCTLGDMTPKESHWRQVLSPNSNLPPRTVHAQLAKCKQFTCNASEQESRPYFWFDFLQRVWIRLDSLLPILKSRSPLNLGSEPISKALWLGAEWMTGGCQAHHHQTNKMWRRKQRQWYSTCTRTVDSPWSSTSGYHRQGKKVLGNFGLASSSRRKKKHRKWTGRKRLWSSHVWSESRVWVFCISPRFQSCQVSCAIILCLRHLHQYLITQTFLAKLSPKTQLEVSVAWNRMI